MKIIRTRIKIVDSDKVEVPKIYSAQLDFQHAGEVTSIGANATIASIGLTLTLNELIP